MFKRFTSSRIEAPLSEPPLDAEELIDSLSVAIFRTGADGVMLASNAALRELLGYPETADLTAVKVEDLYVDVAAHRRLVERIEQEERLRNARIEFRHRDGTTLDVAVDAIAVRDDDGRMMYYEGMLFDISEQKHTEARIARLARILDQSENEIYLFDAETYHFVEVNQEARRNLGYSSAELREMRPWDLEPEFDASSFAAQVEPLRTGENSPLTFETTHRRKDGSSYPVAVRLQHMAQETPAVFAAVILDITEQRKIQEHLRLSQRMEAVGVLAGGLAHDFNNLLTAIKGHAELALERRDSPRWPDEHFEVITRAADRGAALTHQVLAFSRQQVRHPVLLCVNDVVQSLDPLLRSTLGEDVRLDLRLDRELATVLFDPGQMEEILLNLAINARDSMPHGGTFKIETSNAKMLDATIDDRVPVEPGDYVKLIAADTGVGMEEEVRRRAFEPFFTTKGSEGTGLGLAMIYGIVKQSDGYIWLESVAGEGTSFTICLPQVETPIVAEAAREDDSKSATLGVASETIVLVEDNKLVRDLVCGVLEVNGYTVLVAGTGEAALEDFADRPDIHLLLTDVVLPGLPGTELVRRFAGSRPDLRALLISGYADEKLQREGLETLGVPLLEKPFTPKQLLRAVREALDSSRGISA